jgi:hypothetical protein
MEDDLMLGGYQAPKERSILTKGCMALAILVVIGSFGMLGMAVYILNKAFSGGTGSPNLETIANITRVSFPASAKLYYSHLTLNWDHQILYAKVEMDRSEVDRFVRELTVVEKSVEDKLGTINGVWNMRQGMVPSWWDPDSVQNFIAVRTRTKPKTTHLLISLDKPDHAVIYLRQD